MSALLDRCSPLGNVPDTCGYCLWTLGRSLYVKWSWKPSESQMRCPSLANRPVQLVFGMKVNLLQFALLMRVDRTTAKDGLCSHVRILMCTLSCIAVNNVCRQSNCEVNDRTNKTRVTKSQRKRFKRRRSLALDRKVLLLSTPSVLASRTRHNFTGKSRLLSNRQQLITCLQVM